MRTFSLLCLGCTLLAACGGPVLPTLPEGEQTVVGILLPAELSAVRRGSHIIEQEGVSVYYAESSLVNLREYQNKRVTLRGRFEHNTNPEDLPVLVVDSIVDVEETMKEYTLSGISVRLEAPVHWNLVQKDGAYIFHMEGEENSPILVLSQEQGAEFPEGGIPIVVDATRASRLVDETSNMQIVYVKREDSVLSLQFTPGERLSAQRLQEDFIQVLNSIELLSSAQVVSPSIGTGALSTPCGGTAGILCPTGYFCDIQDFEENIGRCRKL